MPPYAGSDWLLGLLSRKDRTLSPFGARVADVLGAVFQGIYHLSEAELLKVDWSEERWIEIRLSKTLATWDFNHLTALVVIAHDACMRVEISPCHRLYLRVMFHQREGREGSMSKRHPTLEAAAQLVRQHQLDLRAAPPVDVAT